VAEGVSFDLWAGTNAPAGYYVYSFVPHQKTAVLPTEGSLNVDMADFFWLLEGRPNFSKEMYLDVVRPASKSCAPRLGDVRLVQL